LNLTSQNIYHTLISGLQIFAGQFIYHLPRNVISAIVALVYIDLQPEHEISSSTRFGPVQKFGKIELGVLSSKATQGKKFCTGSEFFVIAIRARQI